MEGMGRDVKYDGIVLKAHWSWFCEFNLLGRGIGWGLDETIMENNK